MQLDYANKAVRVYIAVFGADGQILDGIRSIQQAKEFNINGPSFTLVTPIHVIPPGATVAARFQVNIVLLVANSEALGGDAYLGQLMRNLDAAVLCAGALPPRIEQRVRTAIPATCRKVLLAESDGTEWQAEGWELRSVDASAIGPMLQDLARSISSNRAES